MSREPHIKIQKQNIFFKKIILLPLLLAQQIRKTWTRHNFHTVESAFKDQALRVINHITRSKYLATDLKSLRNVICKKLEEGFGGRFYIILKGEEIDRDFPYFTKVQELLHNNFPDIIRKNDRTLYFQPLLVSEREVGILIAEVYYHSFHALSLSRVLPVLSDQVSIIIDNFETHNKLRESIVNEEREKLRSLILSSISHDLKTPLFSIIGSLNIFKNLSQKNKLTPENSSTLINTALEEAERLSNFISNILEMTRIESGSIRVNKQQLNPYLILLKTLERFDKKLEEYNFEINLDQQIEINFDQLSLEQIIQNLVDNAMKYSPKNTKIKIYDEISDKNYRIFIEDEGKGIDPTKLDLIFNKFQRFNLEDKVVGTGLGLSITKALMEINNSTIIAKNSFNKTGAIFILEFRDFIKKTNI